MKAFPAKKTTKPDVLSTFGPLNFFLRIFGLYYITRENGTLKWSMPIWKISGIITTALTMNIITLYFKLKHFNWNLTTITFKDAIRLVYILAHQQYIIDVCLVYKFGRQSCVNYFKLYEQFEQIMGTSYYRNIRSTIRNLCCTFMIVGIIDLIADYLSWSISFGSMLPAVYVVDYLYIGLKMLSILDMIANYIQMWYRLKAIADVLDDYYTSCENRSGLKEVINRTPKVILVESYKVPRQDMHRTNLVMNLTRCYLLLIEQCEYLNVKYGVRIIINNILFILDMVMMFNLVVRLFLGTLEITYGSRFVPIISTLIRIFSGSVILICGVHRCEQNYRQNDRIKHLIDHLVLMKRIPFDVRESLMELKELVMTRPVKYHAMNFYQLEYATLVSVTSVIVTHTVILLQSVK